MSKPFHLLPLLNPPTPTIPRRTRSSSCSGINGKILHRYGGSKATMSDLIRPNPLYKQKSWSNDAYRDEAWSRRKDNNKMRRSKSVTDEDLDELKGCIELGFGFDSPQRDQRLADTLPALDLYYAVHKQYNESVAKSGTPSESDGSPVNSPQRNIFGSGDNPQLVKTRLRQWAQVVACSVRQSS